MKDVLGNKFDNFVVRSVTYEPTDPTIDSQIVSLQSVGADTLIVQAIAKFAAQAIRKVYDIGWKPLFILNNSAVSVAAVIRPAGVEKAVGIIGSYYVKDPTDPAWSDDSGMKEWRAFMTKHMPGADMTDAILCLRLWCIADTHAGAEAVRKRSLA